MSAQFKTIQKKADALFKEAHFLTEITNQREYKQALALMEYLLDDYAKNKALIDVLSIAIESWENSAEEFSLFNQRIAASDDAESVLALLMEQYHLNGNDFPEIGSKSLISKIIHKKRRLSCDHIQALCRRFNLSANIFFNNELI